MAKNYKMDKIQDLHFYEKINLTKLKYIINNPHKYESIISEQERDMRRYKNYNAFAVFQKIVSNCVIPKELEGTEFALIKVSYVKGDKSNNIGRWYCYKSIGLQSLTVSVRHTICEGIWTDIDQVNSHPTIFQSFMKKYGFSSPLLNECLNDRENFLQKVGGKRELAKTQVIAIINGAKREQNKVLKQLSLEIKPCLDYVINLPEYSDILEYVKKTYDVNIEGKTISRILQIIENNLLESYIEWAYDKGFIEDNQISLIFDGFQLLSKHNITDDMLIECQDYATDKTGYHIPLKIKPFDCPLELPEHYNQCLDDIPAFINDLRTGLTQFKEKHITLIETAIETLTHYDVIKVISELVKNKVYCENEKSWFYCNSKNIWKESDKPYILYSVIPEVGFELIQLVKKDYVSKSYDIRLDPDDRTRWSKKAEKCDKLCIHMKLSPFTKNVVSYLNLFLKVDFKTDYLNSNTHLFAFGNKVFDFKLKPDKPASELEINDFIRLIKPTDYIMINSEYDFPESDEEDDIKILNKYFDDLFPVITEIDIETGKTIVKDTGKKEYVLNVIATSLNGANNEQSVFFHNGKGSNGKTTFMSLIGKAYGNYYACVSPETFTEKMKANGNNEVFRLEGKRFATFNEPDGTNGSQLQTSTLKNFGEVEVVKLRGKCLYKQDFWFINQSTLHGCMNNKPSLSGVDGGIARRVKIIDYNTQFVINPQDVNYEKKIDPSFIKQINSDSIKYAFIRMLLKRWISDVRPHEQLTVPECVIDASRDYCNDCNSVLKFINEHFCITLNSKHKLKSSDIYGLYKTFMKTNTNEFALTDKKFKEQMVNIKGIVCKRMKDGVYYIGLILKENYEGQPDPEPVAGPNEDFRSDSEEEDETKFYGKLAKK